ncbi:TniQ family protein [Pseudomonas sp. PS01302]|uniref:TniQ family protein n=1 Tax=Pseudomonas sp. PS01302 TaxID=2991438 RepID=UPI00249C5327|nr:TniQ family protein [Pseudomonas sp. PS01302]
MSKILFLPAPLPEESPTSVLRRMAIRHGCTIRTDLKDLFGEANFYRPILVRTHPIIQAIATQSIWNVERFLSGFYEPVGPLPIAPPLRIGGQVVKAEMVRKNRSAFCSECWATGREYFIKDLRLAVYCPYHLRQYLDKCPRCGTDLSWCSLLSGRCRCKELPTSPACTPEDADIERQLLNLFRQGDNVRFSRFDEYLKLLDFLKKDQHECSAVRTLIMIAFALLNMDRKAILCNLEKLHALYPDIPKRIICAKLSLVPAEEYQDFVKTFLLQNTTPIQQQNLTPKTLSAFYLTGRQISAWQNLNNHQWKTARKTFNILPATGRYHLEEVQTMAAHILQLKLNNGFSQKKTISGIKLGELKKNLLISMKVLRDAINEKLLHPIIWQQNGCLFDPTDIENFSQHYISVRKLSANTQIPVRKIRSALRHLELRSSEFRSQRACLHVMNIETSKAVIEWCTPHPKKYQKRDASWFGLPKHDPSQAGIWLNSSAAAKFLGVGPPQIGCFVAAGLVAASVGGSKNNAYLIEETALVEFKLNYISVTEAAKLLGLTLHSASTVLKQAGIAPVTGPGVDRNSSYHFLRSQVLASMRPIDEADDSGITNFDASRQLHLPPATIVKLINAKALELVDPKDRFKKSLKKRSVDEFYDHYATELTVAKFLNVPIKCVVRALSRFGINPISEVASTSSKTQIYRIDDVAAVFSLPCRPNSIGYKAGKFLLLEKVSIVRKKHQLSAVPFFRLFIASGFVDAIGNYEPVYLLESDILRISQIMEKYCIISQANKYLGHPNLAHNLIRTKKIDVTHPLLPYTNYPMVERVALYDYALKNHLI